MPAASPPAGRAPIGEKPQQDDGTAPMVGAATRPIIETCPRTRISTPHPASPAASRSSSRWPSPTGFSSRRSSWAPAFLPVVVGLAMIFGVLAVVLVLVGIFLARLLSDG